MFSERELRRLDAAVGLWLHEGFEARHIAADLTSSFTHHRAVSKAAREHGPFGDRAPTAKRAPREGRHPNHCRRRSSSRDCWPKRTTLAGGAVHP